MKAHGSDLKLALVSNDRETIEAISRYFERAGEALSTSSRLENVASNSEADVVFFFADDYPQEDAVHAVMTWPVKLMVVVTANGTSFSVSLSAKGNRTRVLILSPPATGSMLHDAVRLGAR
jgi:hypothetical protein